MGGIFRASARNHFVGVFFVGFSRVSAKIFQGYWFGLVIIIITAHASVGSFGVVRAGHAANKDDPCGPQPHKNTTRSVVDIMRYYTSV